MEQQQVGSSPSKIAHDIFEDPAIARARREDPFFRLVGKWWKQILIVVLAVAAAVFARHRFQETYVSRMAESSQLFSQIGHLLESLELASNEVTTLELTLEGENPKSSETEKKLEEAKKNLSTLTAQFTEGLRSLEDAQAPYSDLASVYRTFYVQRFGTKDERELEISRLAQSKEGSNVSPLLVESAALARARILLDGESTRNEGRQALKKLAETAHYFRIQAALALMRTSEGESERAESSAIIEKIKSDYPEQAEIISQELARVG